jgi:amino acid transporter
LIVQCVILGCLQDSTQPRHLRSFSQPDGTAAPRITFIAILIGLGHSELAMSGEESFAQVNREIEAPKLKNLFRAGLVIFIYSLLFTSLVSFFAVMIIPDADRSKCFANLIGGLSMYLVGHLSLRLSFHALVVLAGVLILSGAVNTAIIGSNGVLNRVAEDGVLPAWFRDPHHKYGTTHRLINVIAGLQLVTIIASQGNVYVLGEAYAFDVIWSFAMKALAVLVLRFTEPEMVSPTSRNGMGPRTTTLYGVTTNTSPAPRTGRPCKLCELKGQLSFRIAHKGGFVSTPLWVRCYTRGDPNSEQAPHFA